MRIEWNKVTKFSQVVAIVLFVLVFFAGFWIGRRFESVFILGAPLNSATFSCAEGKVIRADFYRGFVHLEIGWRTIYLPQAMSASGARYSNDDESFVFWNKGDTAFVTQGDPNVQTYKDCVIVP